MSSKLNFLFLVFLFLCALPVTAQLKGQAKHLPGTWKYEGGSGFEVWKEYGKDELIGYGFRTTKFRDTVKVEDLKIALVNNSLIYSLSTKQLTEQGIVLTNYRFISNKRELDFKNIENEMPSSVRYKFGFFNKRKLRIYINYEGEDKPVKLKLTKVIEE